MGFDILEDCQFRPLTPIRVVVPILRTLNNTKEEKQLLHLKEEEEEAQDHNHENEHEEECHTPKLPAAHVILKQPLVCPPAPKKPRQARSKFKSPNSQSFFKVPDDLASVFILLTSTTCTSTTTTPPPAKRIRAS